MPNSREWLNWDEPCLPQAAAWLIDRYGSKDASRECDLRELICVLPGSRAGRLLLAELIKACEARELRLVPPRVLTPGAMVDVLLADTGATSANASGFESHLAWIAALQGVATTSAASLGALVPQAPMRDDVLAWNDLAKTLAGLHELLAGELKDFDAAAETAERMSMPAEGERWRVMAMLADRHRAILDRQGLRDHQVFRREGLGLAIAMASRGELLQRTVVLVGVSDLNAIQRATLNLITVSVTALVHAPEDRSESFDELGTVRVDRWTDCRIDVPDTAICVVERPSQQAQEVMRFIADAASEFTTSQMTIGVTEPSLIGEIHSAGRWADVAVHDPVGAPLRQHAPYRLLLAAADWIEDHRFDRFASLLRHPDVERWVTCTATALKESSAADEHASGIADGQIQWLTVVDRYFTEHLQGRLTGRWLGEDRTKLKLKAVFDSVGRLFAPLRSVESDARPLQEWCQPVLDVLANAYASDSREDDDKPTRQPVAALANIEAVLAMRDAVAEIANADPQLQPRVNAPDALRFILDLIADVELPRDREPNSVEALGWLELHLDTAQALTIVGVNEGSLPEAVIGHAYLPDSLRTKLGLMDNARRFARDAYLLQAIVRSRQRLQLIVGRSNVQGDPLSPSRLLLACDEQSLLRRVTRFAESQSEQTIAPPRGLPRIAANEGSKFVIPALPPLEVPPSMRVTDFKRYLHCPFRYALDRLIELESLDDRCAELEPMPFGSLMHAVLATLGEDTAISSTTQPEAVYRYLGDRLREIVKRRYGSSPLPSLRLQIAHIDQRLRSFAKAQARLADEGWRLRHCEIEFKGQVSLDVPGEEPMPLRGQIDRIDFNERHGRWRVIDYKTSESSKSPMQAHHECRKLPEKLDELKWIDLQLPLYHLLVTRGTLQLPGDQVELGYIVLPKQTDGVEWLAADWTSDHISHGLDRARSVVQAIRRREFSEMNMEIDPEFDRFARICQTSAFKSEPDTNGESEGAV